MEFSWIFSVLYNYNKHCPNKKIRITKRDEQKPWLTNGLRNACLKKNKMYKDFLKKRTKTSESKYKTYKNKLTSILRYSEKGYYQTLEIHKHNIKETWKILNTIIRKNIKGHVTQTHLSKIQKTLQIKKISQTDLIISL